MENRRILFIDDNPSIHEDYRKILCPDSKNTNRRLTDLKEQILKKKSVSTSSQQHFVLDSALQGQEGYQKVSSQRNNGEPYALAFVDMRMPPGWDGLETIEQLWKVDPELQIVICSAFSDYDWKDITDRIGISENLVILKKPFDKEEVLQLAHALTKKWGLHQQSQIDREVLEEKVDDRTKELTFANNQLKEEMNIRERMETELRLAQKLESIGQLAAGIAHEINTPIQFIGDNINFFQEGFKAVHAGMNSIQQWAQERETNNEGDVTLQAVQSQLKENEVDYFLEEIPKALGDTIAGVNRIAEIVQAMKTFSHPGVKDMQETDLNALIENTVKVSIYEWKYAADMDLQLSPNLPMIPCHPNELSQVILNLIVNAAHAIVDNGGNEETKGTIRISTTSDAQGVTIAIADTGVGIPQQIQDKIFDPFFTTKEVGKGTGQGLAMAYTMIAKNLKGTLTFTTKEGEGTTFYLILPILHPTTTGPESTSRQ